jgi:histidine decarboxylase
MKISIPVCLLAGRTKAIKKFHEHTPGFQDAEINARLVAYCSDQAHSSVEKAALIGLVRMRFIEADEKLSLRGAALKDAIEEDIRNGLIPFWVSLLREKSCPMNWKRYSRALK